MPTATVRTFTAKTDNGPVHLCIHKATRQEIEHGDFSYSAYFNKAIRMGLPTAIQMLRNLKAAEAWGDEQDSAMEQLRKTAIAANQAFQKGLDNGFTTDEERARLAKEKEEANAAFTELRQEIDSLLSHTADKKAEVAYRNYMVACTTRYADVPENGDNAGNRVWDSVDELLDADDNNLVQRVAYEYVTFDAGLDSEWKDEEDEPVKATESESETLATPATPATPEVTVAAEPEPDVPTVTDPVAAVEPAST